MKLTLHIKLLNIQQTKNKFEVIHTNKHPSAYLPVTSYSFFTHCSSICLSPISDYIRPSIICGASQQMQQASVRRGLGTVTLTPVLRESNSPLYQLQTSNQAHRLSPRSTTQPSFPFPFSSWTCQFFLHPFESVAPFWDMSQTANASLFLGKNLLVVATVII